MSNQLQDEENIMTDKNAELMPCPFCGSEVEFQSSPYSIRIECSGCLMMTRYFIKSKKRELIKFWNTREKEQ